VDSFAASRYNASSYLGGNSTRYGNGDIQSKYGWMAEHGTSAVTQYLQLDIMGDAPIGSARVNVSGLVTMGATFGGFGTTSFEVYYSIDDPPVNESFIFMARNVTNGTTFYTQGKACFQHLSEFSYVINATAIRVHPLTWKAGVAGISAPAMRLGVQTCN
jgi:hypothetical protein